MHTQRAGVLALLAMFAGSLPVAACGDDADGGSASSSQGGTASGTSGTTTGGTAATTSAGMTGTDGPTTGTSGSSGTTGDPPTTGSTGGGTTSGTTSTTGPSPTDCCVPHRTPGCADSHIEACVCGADLTCCVPNHGWDEICVQEVMTFGCGVCEMAVAN